jgi:ATP phosphoribosyltransferase
MNKMIRLAIQKSGRLSEGSLELLQECGIKINNGNNKLKAQASNFPIEILYLRDDDIPHYVETGVADIGIVGENIIADSKFSIDVTRKLGFAGCRLSLAIPKNENYTGPEYFNGKKIATSYKGILSDFLKSKNVNAQIEFISGSVEIAPGIGLADGICDLVSSGSTLFANGLKEVEVVFKSEAVLISRKDISVDAQKLLQKLLFRMDSVKEARENRYILLNAPDARLADIIRILPGMKSPTILPLAEKGWSSVHSVINKDVFWEVIDQLKEAGAQGILVVPIEKMVV